MKNIAVLWSGGLDSTYLILKRLREGYNINAYYVEILNNEKKTIAEKKAIQQITEQLLKDYPKTFYVHPNPVMKNYINLGDNDPFKLTQPVLWLLAIPVIMSYGVTYEKIEISYIMYDDALSYMEDAKSFLKSLNGFNNGEYSYESIVSYPLIKKLKKEIYYEMKNDPIMKKYIDLTWSCEAPIFKGKKIIPCKSCEPCKSRKF